MEEIYRKTNLLRILTILFVLVLPLTAQAYTPPAGSPLALKLHPRLFLIPDTYRTANPTAYGISVSEMRQKLIAEYKTEFQLFINTIDSLYSDDVPLKQRLNITYDAINFAFLYVVNPSDSLMSNNFTFQHSRDQYGNKAIEHALQISQNVIQTPHSQGAGWEDDGYTWALHNTRGGPINMAMSVVYDWVYPLLTTVEKQTIADAFINLFEEKSLSGYPYGNSNDHGATQNGNYGALAIWGDSIDNTNSTYYADKMQTILNSVNDDWIERIYNFTNYIFEDGSAWPEGNGGGYGMMAIINTSFFTGGVKYCGKP